MNTCKLQCAFCSKEFFRKRGRVNEAKKFGWRWFCSLSCLANSKTTGATLFCSNPGCNKKFYRQQKEIRRVKTSYCSLSCAAIINNKKRWSEISQNICANPSCKTPITRERKYCSVQHRINPRKIPDEVYKKRIAAIIKSFYEKQGRIPVKREMYGMYRTARRLFGTWNKAVKASGLKPNPVRFAEKHMANDGHVCDSLAEKVIDDWLSAKKIKHQRNVAYPNGSYTADFLAKGKLIEFFGLAGEMEKYDQNIKSKEALAKKNKLGLIKIYPGDLFPSNKLNQILTENMFGS